MVRASKIIGYSAYSKIIQLNGRRSPMFIKLPHVKYYSEIHLRNLSRPCHDAIFSSTRYKTQTIICTIAPECTYF